MTKNAISVIKEAIESFDTSMLPMMRAVGVAVSLRAAGFRIVRIPTPRAKSGPVLYSFNFASGGINSVMASTKAEAYEKASREYARFVPLRYTFKRLATRAKVDAYHKSLPLMD